MYQIKSTKKVTEKGYQKLIKILLELIKANDIYRKSRKKMLKTKIVPKYRKLLPSLVDDTNY